MTILTWPLGQSFFVDTDDVESSVRNTNSPAVSAADPGFKLSLILYLA